MTAEVPAGAKLLEPPGTPTFLGFSGAECEAFVFGLKDGLKIWNRTHIKYSDVDKLDISPELKQSIKDEWHYYEVGSDLPEDLILYALVIWYSYTNFGAIQTLINTSGAILVKLLIDKLTKDRSGS
jgi:hypothetical protein